MQQVSICCNVKSQNMVNVKLKRQCRCSFAVFRSSLVEKPNLVLVSKYSTFLKNQKGKIKDIFTVKVIHFNTWGTLGIHYVQN